MTTGIYVWFNYKKPNSETRSSHLDWAGTMDIDKAIKAVNQIKPADLIRVQTSKFFAEDVDLEISIQEIKSSKVLYRRQLGRA